jgi:hypothetical protein
MWKLTTNDFIEKAINIHGNKYDYSMSIYNGSMTSIDIICKEHGKFQQTPNRHLCGRGCPKCGKIKQSNSRRNTTESFINQAINIHGNKYDYSIVEYFDSRVNVKIICPKHGIFYQKPNNHLKGFGCSQCNIKSFGELLIKKWLSKNDIKYEIQKSFSDCKNVIHLRYDFYLPNMNLLIEYDGEPHFKVIDYLGGKEGLTYRQKNDMIKTEYAERNNIKLLRISYKEKNKIPIILKNNILNP